MEYTRHLDGYELSTAKSQLDVDAIHRFLSEDSYWAKGIPRATVEKSIQHSLCFGIYHESQTVGFARMITDLATYGYMADVFILPAHRGKGLSKWMVKCMLEHPDLQGLRRMGLATSDAHGLYAQFGFTPLDAPERFMQLYRPNVYTSSPPGK